jgi:hypothetical protein
MKKEVKIEIFKKQTTRNVHMYISLDTDKDCDLLHDGPVQSTGRTSHDKQNRNCLGYNQNQVMSFGRTPRQDGMRADRQL